MRDWTKAEWIDPTHPWTDPLPVSEYPERLLVDFATRCNLRCPMCPVWGSDDERAIDEVKGIMGLEEARRMLDERSEEHTSELQSPCNLVCRLLLEKKNTI